MTNQDKTPKPGAYRFTVDEQYNGLRLDHYLAEAHEAFSRSLAKRFIDIGGVHLGGRRMRRCSQTVSTGQGVEVFIDRQPLAPMRLDRSQILYQDQDLIVIDKTSGMAT